MSGNDDSDPPPPPEGPPGAAPAPPKKAAEIMLTPRTVYALQLARNAHTSPANSSGVYGSGSSQVESLKDPRTMTPTRMSIVDPDTAMELLQSIGLGATRTCWPCCQPQITVVLQSPPNVSPQGSLKNGSHNSETQTEPNGKLGSRLRPTNGDPHPQPERLPIKFSTQEEAEAMARSSLRGAFLYKHRKTSLVLGKAASGKRPPASMRRLSTDAEEEKVNFELPLPPKPAAVNAAAGAGAQGSPSKDLYPLTEQSQEGSIMSSIMSELYPRATADDAADTPDTTGGANDGDGGGDDDGPRSPLPESVAPREASYETPPKAGGKGKLSIQVGSSDAEENGEANRVCATPGVDAVRSKPPMLQIHTPGSGSGFKMGEWTSRGSWHESAQVGNYREGMIANLHPIAEDDVTLLKELGRGQFGTVWFASWHGVPVAVKQMHRDDSYEDMVREAEMTASLRHPCVLTFYGVLEGSFPMTVLEYMHGGNLRTALVGLAKKGVKMKVQQLAKLALCVAQGMKYLHSRSVVHFDLKAENLLCDLRHLEAPVVKIGDMGLSKQRMATFVSGNMRGTLPWMAPELFFGESSMDRASKGSTTSEGSFVTEKVDIFSFGVVLWEIWNMGELPYQGLDMSQIFMGIMNDKLRPGVPANCHPEWVALMQSCWQSKAAERPTFAEITCKLDEIASLKEGESWLEGLASFRFGNMTASPAHA